MTEPTETPARPHVLEAIEALMADVRGIPRAGEMRTSTAANARVQYTFQKFDDLAIAVGTAFRQYGLALSSSNVHVEYHTWDKTNSSGGTTLWTSCRLVKRFVVTSLRDGSMFEAVAAGEGSDSSDKATNKAETSALKTMLKQSFLIMVGDDKDPDAERPSIDTPIARNAPQGQQGQPQGDPYAEVWRQLDEATRRPIENTPEPSRLDLAVRATTALAGCSTTGDLANIARYVLQRGAQNTAVQGQMLAFRLLAARATLRPGAPTGNIGQNQQQGPAEPPPDHGGY